MRLFRAFLSSTLISLTITVQAEIKIGEFLPALSIETTPQSFTYEPNGHAQMLTVYPASLTSSRNGKFNAKVIEAGYCPKSIIDIKNRSWYVPKSTAEEAVQESIEEDTHNPLCTVSIDHKGKAIESWNLNKKSTTIIVDGEGKVIFAEEGVLNKKEQSKVIELMKAHGKPFIHWPGKTQADEVKHSDTPDEAAK